MRGSFGSRARLTVAPSTSPLRMERALSAKQSPRLTLGALICANWMSRPSLRRTVSPSVTDATVKSDDSEVLPSPDIGGPLDDPGDDDPAVGFAWCRSEERRVGKGGR